MKFGRLMLGHCVQSPRSLAEVGWPSGCWGMGERGWGREDGGAREEREAGSGGGVFMKVLREDLLLILGGGGIS